MPFQPDSNPRCFDSHGHSHEESDLRVLHSDSQRVVEVRSEHDELELSWEVLEKAEGCEKRALFIVSDVVGVLNAITAVAQMDAITVRRHQEWHCVRVVKDHVVFVAIVRFIWDSRNPSANAADPTVIVATTLGEVDELICLVHGLDKLVDVEETRRHKSLVGLRAHKSCGGRILRHTNAIRSVAVPVVEPGGLHCANRCKLLIL